MSEDTENNPSPSKRSSPVERGLVRRPTVQFVPPPAPEAILAWGTVPPDFQQKAVGVLERLGGRSMDEWVAFFDAGDVAIQHWRKVVALGAVAFVASIRRAGKSTRDKKLIASASSPPTALGLSLTFPDSDYSAVFVPSPIHLAAQAQLEPGLHRNFLEMLQRSADQDPKAVADPVDAVVNEALRRRRARRPKRPDEPDE